MGKLSKYRGRRVKKNQSFTFGKLILLPLAAAIVATMLVTWHVTNDKTIDSKSSNKEFAELAYLVSNDDFFDKQENFCVPVVYSIQQIIENEVIDYSNFYNENIDYSNEIKLKLSYPTVYETRIGFLQDLEESRNYKILDLNLSVEQTHEFNNFNNMKELVTSGILDAFYLGEDYHRFKISNCSAWEEFNLYDSPDNNANSIATLQRGNLLVYLGHFLDENNNTWYRILFNSTIVGYINIPENYLIEYSYTEDDVYWLALAISHELGSNWVPESARNKIGCVILNRVEETQNHDYANVNTIYDVLHQRNQYPWASRTDYATPYYEWCENTARSLLEGCERELPPYVVFQSAKPLTNNVYTTYYDEVLGVTEYFCY